MDINEQPLEELFGEEDTDWESMKIKPYTPERLEALYLGKLKNYDKN